MNVVLAAGDPGGSRAVYPVFLELMQQGVVCRILDNGYLAKELPPEYVACLVSLEALLQWMDADCVIWGSSTHDSRPLTLARLAAKMQIPTIHILDNWSNYRQRLCTDGLPAFEPTHYVVMDEVARKGAIEDGIGSATIVVAGHPALGLIAALDSGHDIPNLPLTKKVVLFINEPFKAVLGTDVLMESHCGFLEDEVLHAFATALQPMAKDAYVIVVPHPKDDEHVLNMHWRKVAGKLEGEVRRLAPPKSLFPHVSGIAGMGSLVLYEAYLFSLPVLAMQPNGKARPMKHLGTREGVRFVETYPELSRKVALWWKDCLNAGGIALREEAMLHNSASKRIARLVMDKIQTKGL